MRRLAAAVRATRRRTLGNGRFGLVLQPKAMSLAGVLLLLVGLVALPPPFGLAHVMLAAAAGLLLAALHATPGATGNMQQNGAAARARFNDLCDTLEKRLEQLQDVHWEISESDVRYRDLLDQQSDVILRRDALGRLTFVNKAFVRVFGIDAEAALGQIFRPVVLAVDAGSPAEATSAEQGRRYVEHVETVFGPRWFAWEEHLVIAADGSGEELHAVGRDVTDERRHAAELAEARDQAEAANRAKSRFLASMSHEIRTPMNGILGMSSLLYETEPSDEQRTYIGAIDQSARVLLALIDEILDFSKIEAGKVVLADAPFSIASTAQSVVELLSPRAHDKGLELALTIGANADRVLIGDQARVRQILLNLLSNALKFTDQGGIDVTVTVRPLAAAEGYVGVEIAVEDTGIGLSADDMSRLFLEFEQADAAARRHQGGTGLGLAISKRLAVAMGGDIAVSSTPGKGSRFTAQLVLRDAACDRNTVDAVARAPGEVSRVLLALDLELERRSIAHILVSAGQIVVEATTSQAIAAIDEAQQCGCTVDRVIVDIGCDAVLAGRILAHARAIGGGKAIGIVTVNVLARSSLAAFRQQGFERYLVRPVRANSLLHQIAARVRPASPGAEHSGEDSKAQSLREAGAIDDFGRPVSVLLIEDNEINALLARRVLEMSGCQVEHCSDGQSGVACAVDVIEGRRAPFDLVLMDIHMPGLDGIAAMRAIRRAYAGRSDPEHGSGGVSLPPCPPIIALTANAFPEDRRRYLDEGLDGYLAKPFDTFELKALLNVWVGRGAGRRPRTGTAG